MDESVHYPAILEMLGHYHFLNNAAYLFLPILAGVSVDRRQCHERFYPNTSIGEERSLIILSPLECYHVHDVCTCRETCT